MAEEGMIGSVRRAMTGGPGRTVPSLLLAGMVAGCGGGALPPREVFSPAVAAPTPSAANGPIVSDAGECLLPEAALGPTPAAFEIGASECDVVRLEGRPDDVLVGGSSSAKREAQLLYARAQGKVIYLFADGRLTRIVR